MKSSIVLIGTLLISCLATSAQKRYSGKYRQSWISYTCYLELNPDSTFNKHCDRHMWKPLDEIGKWSVNRDTMILMTDTSIEKLLISDNLLNSHYGNEMIDSVPVIYMPNYYVSLLTYYDNKDTAVTKSWNEKNSWLPLPHGEWKYYNKYGELIKIEVYKKGKLKRIKN